MKDTLIRNMLGADIRRIELDNDSSKTLVKSKLAIEALNNLKVFNDYINQNLDNNTINNTLVSIAVESICQTVNISNLNIGFENIEERTEQMTNTQDMIAEDLKSNLSNLIPEIYSDVTNLSIKSNDLDASLNNIEKQLLDIPSGKLPLIENLKPNEDFIYIYTSNGIDINTVIDTPVKLYNELISKTDIILLEVIKWAVNEFSIKQSFIQEQFNISDYVSVFNNLKLNDLPGLLDIDITYVNNKLNVQITEKPNTINFKSNLISQSKMTEEQWLEFNKNGRSENDKTVLKTISVSDMLILVDKIKLLNQSIIKSRVDFNNEIFINKINDNRTFTELLDLLKDSDSQKSRIVLEVLINALIIRDTINQTLYNYCFNVINSLYMLLNKNIAFYKY